MTAVNANAKQLAAIEAVSTKVTVTENELNALAERTTRHALALCVALWRHTCRSRAPTPVNAANPMATTDADDDYVLVGGDANTNANTKAAAPAAAAAAVQKFAVDTAALRRAAYDLRMGTHWRDEALMQQLFALDNVFGDDTVKAKRKEQVTRIKALIARAEHLRIRNRRLDALLKRLPMPPAAVGAATDAADTPMEPVSPAPSAAAADGEVKYADAAGLAAAAAGAAAAQSQAQPMDTATASEAAAPAAAPRAATPQPPTPAAVPAAALASALDVKHAPEQAAAIAASAAAAAAAEEDESSGFVIPAKVKAQWPRLRADFDTRDAGDSIHLSAALPGVLPQDLGVSLSADNTVLTVRGLKRPQPQPQRRRATPFGGWFGSAYDYDAEEENDAEEDFGWFEEQFHIPARLGVDAAKAERVFRGGRLTIILPRKAAPQPQQRPQTARCYAQPQYQYRPQPQPQFGGFGGFGHPLFGGRPSVGGWF